MRASLSFGTKSWADINKKDGYLIFRDIARPGNKWQKYDRWRSEICHRNRDKKLWLPFREGKLNILVLIYVLYLKLFRR